VKKRFDLITKNFQRIGLLEFLQQHFRIGPMLNE